jgi:prepilin signal peptidase PulO-like enzyme (type II secretory pathway)
VEPTTSAASFIDLTIPVLPLTMIAMIIFISLPLALYGGYLAGQKRRKRLLELGREVDKQVGESSTAALVAMLGLLTAFAFNGAINASQSIKDTMVKEAAALGTAFLRVDYLAEPGRTELQKAILEYSKTRILPRDQALDTRAKAEEFIARSLDAQSRLWPLMLRATADPTPAPIKTFVAGAMNEALDAHLFRMAAIAIPLTPYAEAMLLAAALGALFLIGNRAGMLGRQRNWRPFLLMLFLASLMYVTVDIRRGSAGLIRIQGSMLEATVGDMERSLAGRM